MQIEWKKVTWYSQIAAIIVGVLIFALGFYIGSTRIGVFETVAPTMRTGAKDVSYACANDRALIAIYLPESVSLSLSDGRSLTLTHAVAASGVRYTNSDESVVFWSKGNTAFLTEDGATTYQDCTEAPLPI